MTIKNKRYYIVLCPLILYVVVVLDPISRTVFGYCYMVFMDTICGVHGYHNFVEFMDITCGVYRYYMWCSWILYVVFMDTIGGVHRYLMR